MGILLIFSFNVVLHVVITNGIEHNPAPYVVQNAGGNDDSAACGNVDFACEEVNSVEEDFSHPIKFTDIAVDRGNVTLTWHSTENLFLMRITGGIRDKERCLLVDQNYNETTFNNGEWMYTVPCFEGTAGSGYNVSVLDHRAPSSYLIMVPTTQSSLPMVPALAVGESSCPSATLHVLFQRPPVTYTTAHVICVDMDYPQHNVSCSLDTNTTSCDFDVEYGRQYMIELGFEGCSPHCPEDIKVPINSSAGCELVPTPPTPPPPPPQTSPPVTSPTTPANTSPTPKSTTSTQVPGMTTESDGSVVQKPSPRAADHAQRTTVIAVVSAVAAALLIVVAGGCIYRKKRQRDDDAFVMRRLGSGDSDTSSLNTEKALAGARVAPSVLLLYSYDCAVHERVVIEFAAYLKHELSCDVALDIWEADTIKTGGAAKWLDEKLDFSDFIIVIGSAGARFKCQRKKQQVRMKQSRPVPDMFVYGADRITEKVRFAKLYGHRAPQCVVVCFEYSTASDIPPKLDTLTTISLMKDIGVLHSQLRGSAGSEEGGSAGLEVYTETPTGRQLADAIKDAVEYFKKNLDWLGQCLEPLTPVGVSPSDSPKSGTPEPSYSSPKPSPRNRNRTISIDSVLEKRQTRRRQEEETVLPKIPSSNVLVNGNTGNGLSLNTVVPAPVGSINRRRNSSSPPPPPVHPIPPGIKKPAEDDEDEEEDEEDEMLQLQNDIDFITNYQYTENNATDILLPLDALSSSYESTGPSYSFSNPLYSQHSSTKHMLQKNGLGRVSVSLSSHRKAKTNYNNNSFVVDFNAIDDRGGKKGVVNDTSTYL